MDIERIYQIEERIAKDELGLDTYPNEIHIISSEQMLDFYSTVGLPIFYDHWSFGKRFLDYKRQYLSGNLSLAFEIVINSNPVQAFLVENNSDLLQKLVIAHACFGHNAVFKNNYLFQKHARADWIIPYMKYASSYIAEAEEKYGFDEVEKILDACHTLNWYCLPDAKKKTDRLVNQESILDNLVKNNKPSQEDKIETENLLYFLEKHTLLDTWIKEIIRIVRKCSEYFYPQMLTKILNEGHATAAHYYILKRLYDIGEITEGEYLEFLTVHTSVINQPKHSLLNPYAIGFKIFDSIRGAYENSKKLTGVEFSCDSWQEEWLEIVKNYRDDSFILQYLSEEVVRDLKLMKLKLKSRSANKQFYQVQEIHDSNGFREIRKNISDSRDYFGLVPRIKIVDYDKFSGDLSIQVIREGREIVNEQSFRSAIKKLWQGSRIQINIV